MEEGGGKRRRDGGGQEEAAEIFVSKWVVDDRWLMVEDWWLGDFWICEMITRGQTRPIGGELVR